jgi:RHS repeat-associated protein
VPALNPTCNFAPHLVGDPVDTLRGAVVDQKLEFRLTGPMELPWMRHYDSAQCHRSFALGFGHTHGYDRRLRFEGAGLVYEGILGETFEFPQPLSDGESIPRHGHTLVRLSPCRYLLHRHAEPSMAFEFHDAAVPARLALLFKGRHQVRFRYGPGSQLQAIIDSAGRHIAVLETPEGRLLSLTLQAEGDRPEELLVAYTYDDDGNLQSTRNADGHGYQFKYDDDHRLLSSTGRKGFRFQYSYDEHGRCTLSMGEDRLYGVALNFVAPGRLTEVTRPDHGVWRYSFDPAGRLTQIQDALGGVQTFVRDPTGRVVLELDQNRALTRIEYDEAGAPVARITPHGQRVALPANRGAPDPREHRVAANPGEFEYGELFDPAAAQLPTEAELEAIGHSSLVAGLAVVRPHASAAAMPPPQFTVEPLGARWWPLPEQGRVFNHLGKLVAQYDEFGRERRWRYDASGNVAEHIDFDGSRWTYDTAKWHLRRGLTNPLGAAQRWLHTSSGKVARFVDAGGATSEYHYDLNDHLIEVKRQGAVRDIYHRDAAGNLLLKQAGDGRDLLHVTVGPGNLPVRRKLASGDDHTFEYDGFGRYLAADTLRDKVAFGYDTHGHRILELRNGLGIEHNYFGGHHLRESVLFDRFVLGYAQKSNGSALHITDPMGALHEVRRQGNGFVHRVFSNGTSETSQHDVLGRCLFKAVQHPNGTLWSRRFHWSGEGELQRVEDSATGEVRHEYDAAHRLRRRWDTLGMETFEFDLADNLWRQPGLDGVTHDGNRVTAANGEFFTYNDRQHIASRQSPNSSTHYSYDSFDLLTRIDGPGGAWHAEYDALGRRCRKRWLDQAIEYHWNQDQLIAEVATDGRLRIYIYADGLALTPLMFIDYPSLHADPASGRRHFVFSDQLGVPCLIEDERGLTVWKARLHPFGRAEVWSPGGLSFALRFPGHYFDAETGLHCNGFRYYDPVLGRYLQSDPWGIAGGPNVYAYRSNPLLKVDVRGLGEENEPACDKPKPGEEETDAPTPGEPKKALKDMDPAELRTHVEERADALKKAFAADDPEGEKATTLSVGVVEKDGNPETRKVVVTTSADDQELPQSVKKAMLPGEEERATQPTIERLPRRPNDDYDPDPTRKPDPRNNPKTVTDTVVVDPKTGEKTPYQKAENGKPVEGTKHHAEQRMESGARDNGETVLAQQPTKKCCPGCTEVLGNDGNLSKIPSPRGL